MPPRSGSAGWEQTLADHDELVKNLHTDIGWTRAVADHAATGDRPIRLLTLTDATTTAGRTRAQVSAQLARAAQKATKGQVAAFTISDESTEQGHAQALAEIAAHLMCGDNTTALSGAELATGDGRFGLRSHPKPTASITLGGTAVPPWLDDTLRGIVGGEAGQRR